MMLAKLMGIPTLTVDEVAAALGQPGFVVFDTNPARVWREQHLPGARNLDPGEFTEADLPSDRSENLVFYCSGPYCPLAPGAAWRAKRMGYARVFVMAAGISGWLESGKPVEVER